MSTPIYRRDREFSRQEVEEILKAWIIAKAAEAGEEPVNIAVIPKVKRAGDYDWHFDGYTTMIRTEKTEDKEKRIMASIENKNRVLSRDNVEEILEAWLILQAATKGEQAMNFSLAPITRETPNGDYFDGYDADYQVKKLDEETKIEPHPKMPWTLRDESRSDSKGEVSIIYNVFYKGEYVGTIDLGSLGMKDPKYRHKVMALGEIAMMMVNALQGRGGLYPFIDCDE